MSSTRAEAINAATPPTGWTNEEANMRRSYYWAGSGDIKEMLDTEYDLKDAQPIWTHLPQYGNILFIFRAMPSTGKFSYYVWNGIESSVCFIEAQGIDEIRQSINKFGEGRGYLKGLRLVVVTGDKRSPHQPQDTPSKRTMDPPPPGSASAGAGLLSRIVGSSSAKPRRGS